MPPVKKPQGKGKKPAPAPYAIKSQKVEKKAPSNPLIEKRPKNFGIGQNVQPKRDLTRFVKWPKYIRLQRQKKILKLRLKVPPQINQFTNVLDKNTVTQLFKLLHKYRPETKQEKKQRLLNLAKLKNEGKEVQTEKPYFIKFGLNHITALIENKKAKLVIIAHDVDPIELVLWLPALCKKMGIPYCIVKGKARLGTLVNMKTASALAITEVKSQDQMALNSLITAIQLNFNDKYEEQRKVWGGGIMGPKSQAKTLKKEKLARKDAPRPIA